MNAAPHPALTLDDLYVHEASLRALARRLTRDHPSAEDLVQGAWLRALESPPTRADTARGWLATVLRNLARDAFRSDVRRASRERVAASPERVPAAAELAARAEVHRRLLRAVLELPQPRRDLVLLRFFEGLPPREIAGRLGVPPAVVRSRLHRALGELRARLGEGAAPSLAALFAAPGLRRALLRGALVTGKMKASVLLLLLLAVGGAAWLAFGAAQAPAPPQVPQQAPPAVASAKPPRRAPAERVESEPSKPAAVDAPAPPVVVLPPAPAVRRLTIEVLGPKEPDPAPPGVKELKPGEKPVIPTGTQIGGGGRGGMSPVGWSRWAPVPEKGAATVRGRVTDAAGAAVSGATLYRVELDASGARESPASYQWAKEMAKTDATGAFEAKDQLAGTFLVAADFERLMNRPRGLDLAASARAEFRDREVVAGIELRLPLSVASLSSVTGRVLDEDGAPIRNAAVWGGNLRREHTTADGRFALRGIAEESIAVHVETTGFAAWDKEVALTPGRAQEIEVRLSLASKGPLHLAGRVIDGDGAPVAAVPLFLQLGAGRDARWGKTGDDGTFRFDRLPDSLGAVDVRVQVSPSPEKDLVLAMMGPPVRASADGIEIVVQRLMALSVVVKDAATGAPLHLIRMNVDAEIVENGVPRTRRLTSMSVFDEDGVIALRVPKARIVLAVEAKDHRGLVVAVTVPDLGSANEVVVELPPE